ncbi:MAG TPA: sigma-70 family RNA polymerase sigma factor [Verrucomicrobiae bacterium]|nr:sigma-70 family RNA polymerase sigma factor [Verrucomicrobiae bacterium]
MPDDAELLERYARTRAEDAFATLAGRHLNLVYSAALRQLGGDSHAAQDTTQAVFVKLARQAKQLSGHPSLAGWLYTTTRHLALHTKRAAQRRTRREETAMNESKSSPGQAESVDWREVGPLLDEVMHELGERDRLALLLRYFEGLELRAVGEAIGLGENAARMRVDRALEKLRRLLEKRGVTSSGSVLAAALSTNTVSAAPVTLATQVLTAATAAGAASGISSWGGIKLMAWSKTQTAAATLILAVTATHVTLRRATDELRRENQRLLEIVSREQEKRATGVRKALAGRGRAEATGDIASAEHRELLQLRGDAARLRREVGERLAVAQAKGEASANPALPLPETITKQDALDLKWARSELTSQGNATPEDTLKTLLAAVLNNNAESFSFLIETNSPATASLRADFPSRFEALKAGYQDIDHIKITLKNEYSSGKVLINFDIERSRPREEGEPFWGTIHLVPTASGWRLVGFGFVRPG